MAVLYQLVPAHALHAHLIVMARAVIIVKVLIFQQVPQQKIPVLHVQHVELLVALIVVKYVLVVMAVVPVNVRIHVEIIALVALEHALVTHQRMPHLKDGEKDMSVFSELSNEPTTCEMECVASCQDTCMDTCTDSCVGGCIGKCAVMCYGACKNSCSGCSLTCSSCSAQCSKTCTTNCTTICNENCATGCAFSCTGTEKTVVMAAEIKNKR